MQRAAGMIEVDEGIFKNLMKDLEVMYMNVVNSAFDGVGTVSS